MYKLGGEGGRGQGGGGGNLSLQMVSEDLLVFGS